MKLSTRLAAGAMVASLAAVPATAEAKPASSGQVRAQVRVADQSLDRVVKLVKRNRDGAAGKQLRSYRRQLRKATGTTRRLRSSTSSVTGAKQYGSAVRMVGSVSSDCVETLAPVVDDAAGATQVGIANAISACIVTREQVIAALTALMDQVPEAARPYLAKVIAMLSDDGQGEVQAITTALENPALPTDVAAILSHALELATAAIDDALARLNGILDLVPAEVRPLVQGVLGIVTDSLNMVMGMVKDLFTSILGGVPTSGTGTGGLGGLFGSGLPGMNLLQGIFGQGFPFNLVPLNLGFQVPGYTFASR